MTAAKCWIHGSRACTCVAAVAPPRITHDGISVVYSTTPAACEQCGEDCYTRVTDARRPVHTDRCLNLIRSGGDAR